MNTRKKIVVISAVVFLFWSGLVLEDWGEHPDKLWLHRCNSLEKFSELNDRYPNVEVDVVFRNDSLFDITHDADDTFGLSLDSYFDYLREHGGKIWLDIKNLTALNGAAMLAELNGLTDEYRIDKERLIVESSNWRALGNFTRAGYYTSYYVSYEKPSLLETEEIDSCMSSLRKIVDRQVVRALSFPGWWYTTIKENLDRPIDLLTWKHRTTQAQLLLSPVGRDMLDDPQLKVILVKDKGHFHR